MLPKEKSNRDFIGHDVLVVARHPVKVKTKTTFSGIWGIGGAANTWKGETKLSF